LKRDDTVKAYVTRWTKIFELRE